MVVVLPAHSVPGSRTPRPAGPRDPARARPAPTRSAWPDQRPGWRAGSPCAPDRSTLGQRRPGFPARHRQPSKSTTTVPRDLGSGLSCWSGTGGWPEFSYHRCVRVPEARSGVGRGRSRPGTSSGLLSTRVLHHEEAAPQSPPPLTAALAGDTIDTRLDHVRPSVTGTCAPSTQRYAGQFVRFPLRNSSALVASRC